MNAPFSGRTGPSQPNRIALAQAQAVARGQAPIPLNDSNPTRHGLTLDSLPGVYRAEPRGPIELRLELARFLGQRGTPVDPDDLYLLSSTSQAYSWLMKLLCDAGEAILEPRPGYPLIESIARLECVQALPYQLNYDGSWTIDLAGVRTALDGPDGARIRAIVLINPNNPTGSYLHPQEREALIGLARSRGLAIIADEVFFDYQLDPLPGRRRLAGEEGALTFALDGLSKMLAAPQAKLGWIQVSGPAEQVAQAKARLDLIADDYLPMSQLISQAAPGLLAQASAQSERVRDRCVGNLRYLGQALDGRPISLLRAEGGWNVLLRFPAVIDETELVERLIEGYGYSGQPGYFFDMPSNGYLALSLLPEPQDFRAGLEAIISAVDDLLG
ncbi:aminotransferase [Bifidobacterium actinocoloniiforme DSM 22766]|uniref:Aminotransferase n=1 Tax=Bifidobacterium actinocoloniiforme DSM 22766 TaxID=1437605 RepID=A0A086Z147_9BIFI|nr:pyridoxal phosphate-dependent aminotransferase [Bifidobacterium actinocoloniiforme]AKV55418.1 aminotransferase [Bifidobacterium actinocoloniiforme DSM 22766]KFI40247.1 aminotransferase [Bifidobacterium actinocoloniiforme DSM 22766]